MAAAAVVFVRAQANDDARRAAFQRAALTARQAATDVGTASRPSGRRRAARGQPGHGHGVLGDDALLPELLRRRPRGGPDERRQDRLLVEARRGAGRGRRCALAARGGDAAARARARARSVGGGKMLLVTAPVPGRGDRRRGLRPRRRGPDLATQPRPAGCAGDPHRQRRRPDGARALDRAGPLDRPPARRHPVRRARRWAGDAVSTASAGSTPATSARARLAGVRRRGRVARARAGGDAVPARARDHRRRPRRDARCPPRHPPPDHAADRRAEPRRASRRGRHRVRARRRARAARGRRPGGRLHAPHGRGRARARGAPDVGGPAARDGRRARAQRRAARRLLASLVSAGEEERRRIASDIHDDSIQDQAAAHAICGSCEHALEPARRPARAARRHREISPIGGCATCLRAAPAGARPRRPVAARPMYLEQSRAGVRLTYAVDDRLVAQPPAGDRADPVPDRAGGAHERAQARPRDERRDHARRAAAGLLRARPGRRDRLLPGRRPSGDRTGHIGLVACASAQSRRRLAAHRGRAASDAGTGTASSPDPRGRGEPDAA